MASRSAQNPVEMAPSIDSFLVADCADAVNGKLYVMGAGFDTVLFTAIPALVQFALAAVFHVPWNDTNRRLRVEAQLEDDNYDSLGWWNLQGEVEAGRPAGARGGNVPIVFATKVMFQIPEQPEQIPYPFGVRLRFADDERRLPLRLSPPPGPFVQAPSS